METRVVLLASLLAWTCSLRLAGAEAKSSTLSLLDILQISVATRTPMTPRETPGIVSVITHDEMVKSGARTIIDVLQMVPGMQFAADYAGNYSIGFRGLTAGEGKVLVMIDGLAVNTLEFDVAFLGDRYPLDQIKQVEVIRGPGSAMYGSSAEIAVINIITTDGEDISGADANATYGRFSKKEARRSLGLAYGKRFGVGADDLDVSIKTYFSKSQASDQDRLYPDGNNITAYDNYVTKPQHVNAAISTGGFSARILMDRYFQDSLEDGGLPLAAPATMMFGSYHAVAAYKIDIGKLEIKPEIRYQRSYDFFGTDYPYTVYGERAYSNVPTDIYYSQITLALPAVWKPTDETTAVFGVEELRTFGRGGKYTGFTSPYTIDPDTQWNTIPSEYNSYTRNTAAYAQVTQESKFGNLTLGGRGEDHQIFGRTWVPRAAYVKIIDAAHIKLLHSKAFRYPSPGNIDFAGYGGVSVKEPIALEGKGLLQPEKSSTSELELGYSFSPQNLFTVNYFDTTIKDAIQYVGNLGTYSNKGLLGTRGFELENRLASSWGYSALNFSYYTAKKNTSYDEDPASERYRVPNDDHQLTGFAARKWTWNLNFNIMPDVSLNPQTIWWSPRYNWDGLDDSSYNLSAVKESRATLLNNIYLKADHVFVKNLSLGIGAFNIANSSYVIGTAQEFSRNPMPGPSREIVCRIDYSATF